VAQDFWASSGVRYLERGAAGLVATDAWLARFIEGDELQPPHDAGPRERLLHHHLLRNPLAPVDAHDLAAVEDTAHQVRRRVRPPLGQHPGVAFDVIAFEFGVYCRGPDLGCFGIDESVDLHHPVDRGGHVPPPTGEDHVVVLSAAVAVLRAASEGERGW